jgi:hypothetical protein
VEKLKTFTSCPLSNEVISGHGKIEDLQTGYDGLKKRGINVMFDDAVAVDPVKKTVKLKERQDPEIRLSGDVPRHRLQLCGHRRLQRRTGQNQPPARLESRSPDPGPEEAAGRHEDGQTFVSPCRPAPSAARPAPTSAPPRWPATSSTTA